MSSVVSTESQAIIRLLPMEERHRLAAVYEQSGEPLPGHDADVLVIEKDGEIVGSMGFHNIVALGLTYVNPKYQTAGGSAIKLLGHAATQLFHPGDSLFVPVSDNESTGLVERLGCKRIGELYRKDF